MVWVCWGFCGELLWLDVMNFGVGWVLGLSFWVVGWG